MHKVIVINLDRSRDRLDEFVAHNGAAVDIERFAAIEGKLLDQAALERAGIIRPDHLLVDGALGNTMSHLTLWQRAIDEKQALTICEDDAILNRNFADLSGKLLDFCREHFDIVFWGWNFDAPVIYDLYPGGGKCTAFFNQAEIPGLTDGFKAATLFPSLQRVYEVYGTFCYTISPKGARRLMEICLPIGDGKVPSQALGYGVDIVGADIAMNAAYRDIFALACVPPIAICRNDVTASTVGDSVRVRRQAHAQKKVSSYLID